MFCKWCGGNIASSDTKCKRCGKEVPPLSDCGGFYDLVPNAKKMTEAQPPRVVPSEMPTKPPAQPEPVKNKKNGKKSRAGRTVLAVVGFALVVSLLFVVLGKVNQYARRFDELRNNVLSLSGKIDDITKESEPEEPEPEKPELETPETDTILIPLLAEQNVSFSVQIMNEDSLQKVSADVDLGDYSDTAIIAYDFNKRTGAMEAVEWELEKAETVLRLIMDRSGDSRTQSVSVSYELDDAAFGLSEVTETYKWQYRFGEESDWEDISDEVFLAEETELSVKKADLQELMDENEGALELRCEIYRENEEEGSLTVVVEGIVFYEEINSEE